MSAQQNLNIYWTKYVLYNVNFIQGSTAVYNTDCSDVCAGSYDINGNFFIADWYLDPTYTQPLESTLVGYNLTDVETWFYSYYTAPVLIQESQPFIVSTSILNTIRTAPSMVGWLVQDSTTNEVKQWNGTTWIPLDTLFLSSNGGTLNGDLDMDGHEIKNVSFPISIYNGGTSTMTSIPFTANTARLISVSGFTTNLNTDFSLNASTGQVTYTGSATKNFDIQINFSVRTLISLIVTQTFTLWVSKNGSLTSVLPTSIQDFAINGFTYTFSSVLSFSTSLSTGNTLQLAGMYTATANITLGNIYWNIKS